MAKEETKDSKYTSKAPTAPGQNTGAIGAEKIIPYGQEAPKTRQVERMFDSIAPAYDFMNTAMTFGLHRYWRRRTLRRALSAPGVKAAAQSRAGLKVLDVATGTGDLALWLADHLDRAAITGLDLSEGMLAIARRKLADKPGKEGVKLVFRRGDCLHLDFADDSFDLITVAYGVRNFEHLADGLREMRRVLRPGGTLCVLELSCPANPLMRFGYDLYSRRLIPAVGRMVSGDSEAYTYLPESIAACPQRGEMTALMEQAGLTDCTFRSMTLGVVTMYLGVKPMKTISGQAM